MRISLEKQSNLQDIEVLIRYAQLSGQVKEIEAMLYAMDHHIPGKCDDKIYQLHLTEIYYIESVDKRTYIYGEKKVYETAQKLYQLEEELSCSGFVRISKNCIVNQYKLKSMRMLPNSHIEAMLINGEHLLVTRKYISAIRRALEKQNE